MKRATALLALSGIFVTGCLVGIAATHLFYAWKLRRPGEPSRAMVEMFHHRLERDLDLSPEQARQVRGILERSHERAEELRNDVFPRVREIMDSASEEIEALLDEEQRRRFQELRRRHSWRSDPGLLGPPGRMHRRGPPPPPEP